MVQYGAQVMGVNTVDNKRQDTCLLCCRADQPQPRDCAGCAGSVLQQSVFVIAYPVRTDLADVINRRAQADNPGDLLRARLKLVRQVVVQGLFKRDHLDHVAAAMVGRHIRQQRLFSVEYADPRRAEQLMAGKGVEVTI